MDLEHFEGDDEPPARIVGLALNIRREPGPGLLEEKYRHCLVKELRDDKIDHEMNVSIEHRGFRPKGTHYRADVRIDGKMIVEMKSGVRHR